MCAETSFFEKNHHFAEIWKLNFVIHDINKKLKSILSWNPPNTYALWSKIPTRWSRKHFNSQSIVKIGLEAAFQVFRDTLKISSFSMFFYIFLFFRQRVPRHNVGQKCPRSLRCGTCARAQSAQRQFRRFGRSFWTGYTCQPAQPRVKLSIKICSSEL